MARDSRRRERRDAGRARGILALLAALALAAGPLRGAETPGPPAYQKKATWQETLKAATAVPPPPREPVRPDRPPDLGKDEFTLMAWVKTTADGTIFAVAPGGKANWAPGGKALFVRDGKLCYDVGWVGCFASRRSVNDGQWHHVALTGANPQQFFIDGEPDASGGLSVGPDEPGFVARIGFTSPDFPAVSFFKGAIDEVRAYPRRLTAAEVKAESRKPAGGAKPPAGPAVYWTFDGKPDDGPENRCHTALKGSGATYGEGRSGQALELDGRGYAETDPVTAGAAPPQQAVNLPPGLWELLRRDFPDFEADFDQLVFVKRLTYNSNHYYTEYINSSWMPGGNLCVLDLRDGSVREIVPELKGGVFERFDLSFDARKLVFAWKGHPQQGYRIYEVNLDGTGLRQLTFPQPDEEELVRKYRVFPHYHHGTDDMQPCWLPDGGIVFISTRCQYGILCDAPDDFTTTVLYRMDADGKNMRKLTNSSVSEASPAVTPDGRIMYTRWEYVDKGAVSVKCLWVMRPDGSASSEVYKNDIALPPTFIYGRPIPDAPNQYIVLGTPHCPQNGVGTVIRLDMTKNPRTREPMTYMTPYVDIQAEPGFAFRDGNGPWRGDGSGRGPLFKDPYPLSERLFVAAHKPSGPPWNDPRAYGLYLLDEAGAVYPLYKDPAISCFLPYPLKPRKVPLVLPVTTSPELAAANQAVCIVSDVYRGLKDAPRGTIKYLRVLEQIPRPWATRRRWDGDEYDQQHACISKDTHLGLKVQHGIVPVEEDGSAHFLVPAMANIFLQALDGNHMAVQTERTYVNYMPGEKRSCIGCHEIPSDVPVSAPAMTLKALLREPSVPGPQPGETRGRRPLHYATDVQPVWDKHCVACHNGKDPKTKLNLAGALTERFNVSYESLVPERRRGYRDPGLLGPVIGENHPKTGNVEYLPARSLGSHASVLVAMLSKGTVQLRDPAQAERARKLAETHKDIKLTNEELLRVTNWVDTNGQYYGTYWGRRNLKYKDLPDFRPAPTFEMARSMTPPVIPERSENKSAGSR
jgi:hypothetical protein